MCFQSMASHDVYVRLLLESCLCRSTRCSLSVGQLLIETRSELEFQIQNALESTGYQRNRTGGGHRLKEARRLATWNATQMSARCHWSVPQNSPAPRFQRCPEYPRKLVCVEATGCWCSAGNRVKHRGRLVSFPRTSSPRVQKQLDGEKKRCRGLSTQSNAAVVGAV